MEGCKGCEGVEGGGEVAFTVTDGVVIGTVLDVEATGAAALVSVEEGTLNSAGRTC